MDKPAAAWLKWRMRLCFLATRALLALGVCTLARAQQPPTFTVQPISVAAFVGDPLTLSAVAEGDAPITYQWHKDTLPITGAASTSIVIPILTLADTGVYYVVATNPAGATISQTAVVFVTKRPQTIVFAPAVTTAIAGSSIALGATSSSGLAVTLSLVSGSATLSGGLLTGNGGTVVVRATQAGNNFYAAADVVDRTFSFVTGGLSPVITSPPADQTVNAGTTVTLRASVVGTPAPTFQWQKDGVALNGATASAFAIAAASLADAGRYTVTATNSGGTATASAILIVRAAPVITTPPASVNAVAGDRVSFTVALTAFPAPTYQWRRNGTAIPGATRADYTLTSVAAADAGSYDVVATNIVGSTTSAAATLTVLVRDFSGVYFGRFAGAATGEMAFLVRPDRTAVLLGHLPSAGAGLMATNVQVDLAGRFSTDVTTVGATPRAATLRGAIDEVAGAVVGDATGLGVTFEGARAPLTGGFVPGLFTHAAVGSAAGRGHAIVSADGQAFLLHLNNTTADSVSGVLTPAGRLTATTVTQAALDIGFNGGLFTGTLRAGNTTSQMVGAVEALARATRLINLSVRGITAPGATSLITGFVVGGTVPKQVLMRVVGPTLAGPPFNVAGVLPDPTLQVIRGAATVGQNDDWNVPAANGAALTAAAARAGAFPLRAGSGDAALLGTLQPATYSAVAGGGTGTVLAEIYEVLDATEVAGARRLINLSARGLVAPASPFLAGFVIGGSAPQRVLIRGVGPTIGAAPFNVAGALPNPVVTLFRGATTVKTNDDWFRDPDAVLIRDAAVRAGAFALGATSTDAAMLIHLEPGAYTVQVGVPAGTPMAGQTGLALVEIYEATP